ncbi:MAG TPA: zinc ribbon domain-containing protein, partial [Lacipirellulaceae bacterium]|nr:zinc ribbon domain-containing protein [Lacipirellulaceae bacterium]
MKCQHCGVEVAANAAFCQACGQSLAAGAKPAARSAAGADPGKQAFAAAVATRGGPEDAEEVLWEGRFSKLAMLGSWIAAAVITLAAVIAGFVMQATGPTWMWIVGALAVVWIVLLVRLIYLQLS